MLFQKKTCLPLNLTAESGQLYRSAFDSRKPCHVPKQPCGQCTLQRLRREHSLSHLCSRFGARWDGHCAFWLIFWFLLTLAFALPPASSFPPPCLLLCNTAHRDFLSFSPKYQAPFLLPSYYQHDSCFRVYTGMYVSKKFIICSKCGQADVTSLFQDVSPCRLPSSPPHASGRSGTALCYLLGELQRPASQV